MIKMQVKSQVKNRASKIDDNYIIHKDPLYTLAQEPCMDAMCYIDIIYLHAA